MNNAIRYLKIANYRSIDLLELHDIQAFSVFAGPNGCGKSNFFDALDFVNKIIRFGTDEALKQQGGFENIHCLRRGDEDRHVFEFAIEIDFSNKKTALHSYQLKIHQLDNSPQLEEKLQWVDNKGKAWIISRKAGQPIQINENIFNFPFNLSLLLLSNDTPISQFLRNIRLYRIDPLKAKRSVKNTDTQELSHNGRNLAAVLHRLEKDEEISETIDEWLNMIVPNLEKVYVNFDRLEGSLRLAFQEKGLEKPLPARLISDGTVNLLSILVTLFDRPLPFGMTLIEEPEGGLHPHAMIELAETFREIATLSSPIWVTTHNEALVRILKNNELWLTDKKPETTQMKAIRKYDASELPLDQAWLCNVLNGGLP
jgi:predicted ATPase